MKIDAFFFSLSLQRNSSLSGSTRGMYQVSERRSSPSTGWVCTVFHSSLGITHFWCSERWDTGCSALDPSYFLSLVFGVLWSLMFCSFLVLFKLKLEKCKCKCKNKISSTWFRVMYYWKILLYKKICLIVFISVTALFACATNFNTILSIF